MKKKYLLAKWLNNELSEQELAEFEASADFEKFDRIKKYSAGLEVDSVDEDSILKNILQHKKLPVKVVPFYKKWMFQAAAIFIFGLSISFLWTNFLPQSKVANFGQTTTFSLPDESQVVLNAGSEIAYKKWDWKTNRSLDLKGEAFFKVAKGSRFEVNTNLGKVSVLGTQFNVRARENRFEVSCFEGRVKVNFANTELILSHGQNVVFDNGKQRNAIVTTVQPEWIDHQMTFNKEKLSDIALEVKRQYNITIELHTKKSNDLFTGKIPTNNLNVAIQIIETTYNLEAKKVAKNRIIFEEK